MKLSLLAHTILNAIDSGVLPDVDLAELAPMAAAVAIDTTVTPAHSGAEMLANVRAYRFGLAGDVQWTTPQQRADSDARAAAVVLEPGDDPGIREILARQGLPDNPAEWKNYDVEAYYAKLADVSGEASGRGV